MDITAITGKTARRRAVAAALLLASSGLTGWAAPQAMAQDQAERTQRRFDIAAQPLTSAIMVFGRQSGIQVTASGDLVSGRSASAVSGDLAPAEALSRLLSGTGLTFRFLRTNVVALERAPQVSGDAVALGAVRVEGSDGTGGAGSRTSATYRSDSISTEGTKSYTAPIVSLGKGEQVRDIPQSVSVVTRQLIEDQGLVELTQAIAQAAGVSTNVDSRGGELMFYTRGFEVNSVQIDGSSSGGGYEGHYLNPNLAMYDHVEVLRGVDGLFSGMGNPGGTINLVRKRPTRELQVIGTLSAGRWNNYRAELDVSTPITADGGIRARVVGSLIDREFFYDVAMDQKKFFYGIIEADLTPSTTITVGANYEDRKRKAQYTGLPIYEDGRILRLPRSTSLMPYWNGGTFETWEVFAGLEQRFGQDWVLKVNGSRIKRSGMEGNGGWTGDLLSTGPSDEALFAWGYGYEATRTFYDVNLAGTFDLFGQTHKLLIGTDFQKHHWGQIYNEAVWTNGKPTVDLFDFDPADYPAPDYYRKAYDYLPTIDRQRGVYGRLTLEPVKAIKVVLGGRVSWQKYDSLGTAYNTDGTVAWDYHDRYKDSGVFTPYGGIVVDVTPQWSAYVSLARIYKSQASNLKGPLPGTSLDPLKGSSYEIGVKGELADGRLNAAFALYKSTRTGEAVQDPAYPPVFGDFGSSCCYLNAGKIVSKGFDSEVTGELLPGWQISASYTFNKNENDGTTDLPYNSILPKHLAKLWTSYQFGGGLSQWKVGGGVTAQSRVFIDETTWLGNRRRVGQGGYSVWNAMVEYAPSDVLSATLNLSNLFDKTYFASIGNRNDGAWYGEPRSFMLTLRARL